MTHLTRPVRPYRPWQHRSRCERCGFRLAGPRRLHRCPCGGEMDRP